MRLGLSAFQLLIDLPGVIFPDKHTNQIDYHVDYDKRGENGGEGGEEAVVIAEQIGVCAHYRYRYQKVYQRCGQETHLVEYDGGRAEYHRADQPAGHLLYRAVTAVEYPHTYRCGYPAYRQAYHNQLKNRFDIALIHTFSPP